MVPTESHGGNKNASRALILFCFPDTWGCQGEGDRVKESKERKTVAVYCKYSALLMSISFSSTV